MTMYQIQTVDGGMAAFGAFMYPERSEEDRDYFRSNFERFRSKGNVMNQRLIERASTLYEKVTNSEILQKAKNALRKSKTISRDDGIIALSRSAIPKAGLAMQRYIMANPVIRKMYLEEHCNGYFGTYFDIDPGTIGEDHIDYRRVMSGVVDYDNGDEDKDAWVINFYSQSLPDEEEDDLSLTQKLDIIETWQTSLEMIADGEDPTSPEGDDL